MFKKKADRANNSYNYSSKVVVVGDSAVGKTNLLLRLVNEEYKMLHTATIGVDLKIKTITHNDKKLRMQIWDTAGQQRFRTITQSYFKDTAGIILVYSITSRKSFENLSYWFSKIKESGIQQQTILMLVGNKCDDGENREVQEEQGRELAKRLGYEFKQTSARQNINIQQLFQMIGQRIISHIQQMDNLNSSIINSFAIQKTKDVIREKCC